MRTGACYQGTRLSIRLGSKTILGSSCDMNIYQQHVSVCTSLGQYNNNRPNMVLCCHSIQWHLSANMLLDLLHILHRSTTKTLECTCTPNYHSKIQQNRSFFLSNKMRAMNLESPFPNLMCSLLAWRCSRRLPRFCPGKWRIFYVH